MRNDTRLCVTSTKSIKSYHCQNKALFSLCTITSCLTLLVSPALQLTEKNGFQFIIHLERKLTHKILTMEPQHYALKYILFTSPVCCCLSISGCECHCIQINLLHSFSFLRVLCRMFLPNKVYPLIILPLLLVLSSSRLD